MGKNYRNCFVLVIISVTFIAALALFIQVTGSANAAPAAYADCADQRAFPSEGIDLDVTFINRSPLYQAYCVDYPWDIPGQPGIPFLCPGTEDDRRWPEQGEIVTFTAHIVNKGTVASPAFDYVWQIDGVEVTSGTLRRWRPLPR